jgi:uncharacterized protein (TIGR00725 family)
MLAARKCSPSELAMTDDLRLDRARDLLFDASGRRFDPATWSWRALDRSDPAAAGEPLDAIAAIAWLQHEGSHPLRVPIGVIGPRDATPAQLKAALGVGELLADCGLAVICGGRQGVMQAVCEGVARNGGTSIGLLPESDPAAANPFVSVAIATGIGEARNALIARAALCLIAIGDSLGTLSEVALGRHFGKRVFGLEGAARVEGVEHVANPREAVEGVAQTALGLSR